MTQWLKDLFQDAQGRADEMATLCIVSAVIYQVTGMWSVIINHQPFDAQAWGIGMGALLGGAATGMGFKSKGENSGTTGS